MNKCNVLIVCCLGALLHYMLTVCKINYYFELYCIVLCHDFRILFK